MKILLYDSILTGHHTEYISHVLNYIQKEDNVNQYLFMLPEEFKTSFIQLYEFALNIDNVEFEFISNENLKDFERSSLLVKSFKELNYVHKHGIRLNIDHIIFMYFNVFQFALIFKKISFGISGILFLQFVQMNKKGYKNKFKYWYKYVMTKLYVRNKCLKRVYLLNDDNSVDFLNKEFNTNKFRRINDPVPTFQALKDFDIRKTYNIPLGNKVLLHVGSLSERKGTFEIIRACEHLPLDNQSNITLILAGKSSNFDAPILKNMVEFYSERTKVHILWINRFLSNEEMQSFFEQCDLVMIPYKNAEASSGILGHAIFNSLPVLINSSGLLKKLFDEYGYGVQIDEVTPQSIALAVNYIYKNESSYNKAYVNKYKLTHSPNSFAHEILRVN